MAAMVPTGSRPSAPAVWRDATILAALAVLFRLSAFRTDFWYDEILSLERYARPARSVSDILFNPAFKHDNNHVLNTIFMYLVGDHANWPVYRIAALLGGLIAVAIGVALGRRRSRTEGLLLGWLLASSFMLIVYSTEARGYGLLLCFALLAFQALEGYFDRPDMKRAALFWLWVALGVLSHPTMLHFYAAAVLWSGYRLRRQRDAMIRLHLMPLALIGFWIVAIAYGSGVGGGPSWTAGVMADRTLGWTLGLPLGTTPIALTVTVLVGLVLDDARRLWVAGSDEGLFSVTVILGPPIFAAALNPPYLFPRYFLVSLLFLLVVLGRVLARVWQSGRLGRMLTSAVVVATLAGNLLHLEKFLRDGRGHSASVVQLLAADAAGRTVTVASPSLDAWTTLTVQFYERALGLGHRVELVPRRGPGRPGQIAGGADWIVVPSDIPRPPIERLTTDDGRLYILQRFQDSYGPSGLSWAVYRRAD